MSDYLPEKSVGRTPGVSTVFVSSIAAFGGVERLIVGLAEYRAARGEVCTVVCFEDAIGLAAFGNAPISVKVVPARRHFISEMRALRDFSRAWGAGRPWLVFDLKGAFYASVISPPFVLHLTDPPSLLAQDVSKHAFSTRRLQAAEEATPSLPMRVRGELVHRITRRGVRRADHVLAMTDGIAREIRMRYDVPSEVLRPGVVAPPRARSRATREARPFCILSVSRLEPSKRIDRILEAVACLSRSGALHEFQVDLAGGGSEQKALTERARELGVGDRVRFHGVVSDAALEALYAAADVCVIPGVQGYGLPALEALAREVPVILDVASGVSEILGDTPWVQLLREHSTEELAGAILKAARNGAPDRAALPRIPSPAEWASRVSALCQWE